MNVTLPGRVRRNCSYSLRRLVQREPLRALRVGFEREFGYQVAIRESTDTRSAAKRAPRNASTSCVLLRLFRFSVDGRVPDAPVVILPDRTLTPIGLVSVTDLAEFESIPTLVRMVVSAIRSSFVWFAHSSVSTRILENRTPSQSGQVPSVVGRTMVSLWSICAVQVRPQSSHLMGSHDMGSYPVVLLGRRQ